MRYELDFYILEDVILHSHCHENFRSYIALTCWKLFRRRNVFPVRYEQGFHKEWCLLGCYAVALASILNEIAISCFCPQNHKQNGLEALL
jgi:hypothetical protein